MLGMAALNRRCRNWRTSSIAEPEHGVEALRDLFMQHGALRNERDAFQLERQFCLARPWSVDSGLPVTRQTSSAR